MADGWIKLYRGLLESEVMSDDWLCRLWIVLLLKANSRRGVFKGVTIEPGSFAFSYRVLSEYLGVSPNRLRRGLKKLEKSGQISVKATRDFSTVSVYNWSVYQSTDGEGRDTDGHTDGHINGHINGTRTRTKELKNKRKKESNLGKPSIAPEKLSELIDSWNEIPGVKKCQKRDSAAILKGWAKVQKDPSWRLCFDDIQKITEMITDTDWLRDQSFFSLPWLFGSKNSERNIEKILNGNYKPGPGPKKKDNSQEARNARQKQASLNAGRSLYEDFSKPNKADIPRICGTD